MDNSETISFLQDGNIISVDVCQHFLIMNMSLPKNGKTLYFLFCDGITERWKASFLNKFLRSDQQSFLTVSLKILRNFQNLAFQLAKH